MPTKPILVVGGAGFIGSHMTDYLYRHGYFPVVLDNLSKGHREAVPNGKFILGDISDAKLLDDLFASHAFIAVVHFASFIEVGESVLEPLKYYQNNVANTLQLLSVMLKWKVNKFIFSSSAAVYGEPIYTPIDESHPLAPLNPYGHSKRIIEQMLEDFSRAYDFQFASLRYFNAAGADPSGNFRECHEPESHLIPLVLQAASGKRKSITVFGRDYPTDDGTCIRDYVHVTDLCAAHLLALDALVQGLKRCVYNLGTGQGYSVQQVIDVAREVAGKNILVIDGKRREGDPAVLVADPRRVKQELNWQPKYADLKMMVAHAWRAIDVRKHSLEKNPLL